MKKSTLILLSAISLLSPSVLFAQGYLPLVGLPGLGTGTPSFDSYVETIYAITITVAALLAVIKIVIAGVKWMMTDIVTSKGEAKKDIQGAVIGLLVVLSAVLVIEIINPNINNVDLSIPTQSAPARPPSISGVIPEDYSAVQGTATGYTYIPLTSTEGQLLQFETDCAGTIRRDPSSNTMNCNDPVAPQTVSRITSALTSGPMPRSAEAVTAITEAYSQYIAPFDISSNSALTTIQTDFAADDIYFAADSSTRIPGGLPGSPEEFYELSATELNNMAQICQQIASAQRDRDIRIINDPTRNIVACVRKSN